MDNNKISPVKFIWKYVLYYKWSFITGTIYIIITTAFQVISPWILRYAINYASAAFNHSSGPHQEFTQHIIDFFKLESSVQVFVAFALLIIAAACIQGIFRFLMRYIMIGASRKLEYRLRNDYLRHIQSLTMSFYQRTQTGDLMARAINDLNAVRTMLGPGIMYLVTTLFLFIITIVFMFQINLKLTIWAMLIIPTSILVIYKLIAKIQVYFERIQEQFSNITSIVEENVSGIRVIKTYNQGNNIISKFKLAASELVVKNLALAKISAMMRSFIQFMTGLGTLVILWVGGREIIQNTLSVGDLVAFFAYLAMLTWPMIAVGWVLNIWQQGYASLKRIKSIMDTRPEFDDDKNTDHTITEINGEIEFKNVTFSYHADEPPVLTDTSFKINPGEFIAIVGATGSGKSTLINLLPRLYDIKSGQILIDGIDIRKYPIHLLRKNIGCVPQESFLFSDTLRENIVFGVEGVTDAELDKAVSVARLDADMDQFADGYETIVGERGITLSGGQKQRAAIARAIIKNPKILILDDSLSAVDTYTEEEILSRLPQVLQKCTSIIVSHRVSTVKNAHTIYVLEDGRIIEHGNHESLLKQKSVYYKLHQKQLLEKSLEEI